MKLEVFSSLVHKLYALSTSHETLPHLLGELSDYYQCKSSGIHIIDRTDYHVVCEAVPHADLEELQLYARHFGQLKPYLENLRDIEKQAVVGEVYLFSDNQLRPLQQCAGLLEAHELEVIDLFYRENGYILHLVIRCDAKRPPRCDLLLESISLLLPHLQQAFNIYRTIEKLRNYSNGFEQTLDKLNSGIILFDANAKFVYQNHKAKTTLAATDGLNIISGNIVGPTAGETQKLLRLIKVAVERGKRGEREVSGTAVHLGGEKQRELSIIAIPLQPDNRTAFTEESGVYAAVMISSVGIESSGLEPELLQLLYGLTPAEANLAVALSGGSSMERYAERSGISLNTARSYLKLVFQKTGTGRQAELVALLRSIPVVLN